MTQGRKSAIYLRLSMEEEATADGASSKQWESNSITNQRKLLLDYIDNDAELRQQEVAEFCDDGFSGTNMDRPGMQELLKQVRQRKIGCILVKDMSRFARSYIELGDYLNQIFPFMGVRFIAVNDHYDSREHAGNTIELDTAFQTLLYDLYSKDISVKVKTSLQNKCANGEYAFGQVPFGYAKSATQKNAVVVNEREARIVRHIFSLAGEGMSSAQIARELIARQTPTMQQLRYPMRNRVGGNQSWSRTAVRGILNNRFYLGEMLYGKTVSRCVGSKKRMAVPRQEWKVIRNHHEPLVTPEEFALVSSFRPQQSTKRRREKHPLTGKMYCGGCGYAISYKPHGTNDKMPNHFWCPKHSLLQIPDCCTYFRADVLEKIVLLELCRELMLRGDLTKQRESLERFQKEKWNRWKKEMRDCETQHQSLQSQKDTLYERYATRQISAGEYRSLADAIVLQMHKLSEEKEKARLACERWREEYDRPKLDMKEIIRFLQMEKLTKEVVEVFIKKITTYGNKRVEIEWNYAS